jgi:hypothetical protein
MMEAARTSETSVDNYFTLQYIPEDNSELVYCYLSYFALQCFPRMPSKYVIIIVIIIMIIVVVVTSVCRVTLHCNNIAVDQSIQL